MTVCKSHSVRLTFCFIDVDELLMRPVVPYKDIYLKFKRTNPMIDPKSFVLKSTIDPKRGPIMMEKFSNYVDILIDRCPCKLTDLSIPLEQVVLVQCDKLIGMNSFYLFQHSEHTVVYAFQISTLSVVYKSQEGN